MNVTAKLSDRHQNLVRRSVATLVAVPLIGVGVAFFRMAMLGMDTFQVMMGGIDAVFPGVPFGLLWFVSLAVMLIIPFVFKRSLIGPGTILNIVIVGYIIDHAYHLLHQAIPNHYLGLRILWLGIGVLIIAMAIAFYLTANVGISAYDGITIIVAERHPKLAFKYWRIICDCICLLLGVLLFLAAGKPPQELFGLLGVGTIVAALGMGPLIAWFAEKIARPALYPQPGFTSSTSESQPPEIPAAQNPGR